MLVYNYWYLQLLIIVLGDHSHTSLCRNSGPFLKYLNSVTSDKFQTRTVHFSSTIIFVWDLGRL